MDWIHTRNGTVQLGATWDAVFWLCQLGGWVFLLSWYPLGASWPCLLPGRQPMKVELLLPLHLFLPMCQLWLQVKTCFSKPKKPLRTEVLGWCLSFTTSQLLFQDAITNQAFFPLCCSLVFRFFTLLITGKMCWGVLYSCSPQNLIVSSLLPPRQHNHELEWPYFFSLGSCRHSPLKLVIWR